MRVRFGIIPGMFTTRLRLCDIFGIPVFLDGSLIILLLLFVTGGGTFWSGIACAALLLVSITLHELGHALTARTFGCQTRDITLSLLGGCASLIALPRKASQEFWTAVAGPLVSFSLALVAAGGVSLVAAGGDVFDALGLALGEALGAFGVCVDLGSGITISRETNLGLLSILLYASVMNLMLGFFNMLPGFPMDGGRVFRSAMRPFMSRVRATYVAMVVGRVVAVGIGLRGLWSIANSGNWGFVSLLIAWMIWREGYREYVLAQMESSWRFEDGDYRAKVSPPPWGGDGDDCDVTRG